MSETWTHRHLQEVSLVRAPSSSSLPLHRWRWSLRWSSRLAISSIHHHLGGGPGGVLLARSSWLHVELGARCTVCTAVDYVQHKHLPWEFLQLLNHLITTYEAEQSNIPLVNFSKRKRKTLFFRRIAACLFVSQFWGGLLRRHGPD